jgi:hypothetical protein
MRFRAFGIALVVAIATPACGYATSPSPSASFALAAGNYTLKLSGGGICGAFAGASIEGSAPVTVTRSGTSWSVRSIQSTDTLAMSLTTDGSPAGSSHGAASGTITSGQGSTMSAIGILAGTNSATNVAGGPITTTNGALGTVVTFNQPTGSGSCTTGTWTLTPR